MELEGVEPENFILYWNEEKPEETVRRLKKEGGNFSIEELRRYAEWLESQGMDFREEKRRIVSRMKSFVRRMRRRRARRRARLLASLRMMN